MSRFVRASRIAALGFFAAAALTGPVLADALPPQAAEPCGQWKARTSSGCRIAKRHGIVETRRLPSYLDVRNVPVERRYVSLLILGVGF